MDTTWTSNKRSPPIILFIALILFLLLIGILLAVTVQETSHAVIKHGDVAIAIRSCLQKGEYQIWKSTTDPFKYFRICQLGPNHFGMQIVQCLTTGVCEKTAFVKGNGTWVELTRYLSRIATRFNGTIP